MVSSRRYPQVLGLLHGIVLSEQPVADISIFVNESVEKTELTRRLIHTLVTDIAGWNDSFVDLFADSKSIDMWTL